MTKPSPEKIQGDCPKLFTAPTKAPRRSYRRLEAPVENFDQNRRSYRDTELQRQVKVGAEATRRKGRRAQQNEIAQSQKPVLAQCTGERGGTHALPAACPFEGRFYRRALRGVTNFGASYSDTPGRPVGDTMFPFTACKTSRSTERSEQPTQSRFYSGPRQCYSAAHPATPRRQDAAGEKNRRT